MEIDVRNDWPPPRARRDRGARGVRDDLTDFEAAFFRRIPMLGSLLTNMLLFCSLLVAAGWVRESIR
jgi:hypothetical protein